MRRVAVTGLGVVSPVGNRVEDFWNSLTAGTCGVGFITKFDASDYKVKIAAEVKNFDPLCCMEKSDIRKTDLFSQFALSAADQAMQDSGLTGVDPRRLGVYVGSGIGGIHTIVEETEKLLNRGPSRISPYFIPKMIGNMAAGNIAIRYNAQGPCLPVVTACATSSHTVGEAFRAIQYGYADAILAGGAEASVVPLAVAGFINCMALSTKNDPLNSSIPFDKRRDGFVIGEGAGILVLEEYEHAVSRGAKIYAEITGYGNTCDAYHPTAPHPEARGGTEAIRLAAEESGIGEKDVLYINAHGTGTPLNDKIETLAIKKALPELAEKAYVSSTKSMTGHMLGAAGAVEAVASVLALSTGTIPPTIGYREPDPDCDLNCVPNQAVKARPTSALSVSLGFGGHNACLAFRKGMELNPS
ncbi:3-oxoacyl-[acyl-carrier-protein] synthase 2 [Caprobacter fermentans]|uniref:3-oxoacyl-[acyl-carrier-protein] synthase 2 n=1 Tax=Caproicibacter fermentans TaxID=2576756 RepID=A0A6N8I144_9FIRM|nr:beta-ketoacyl-ACP synthase II [Caproicibacter fermentans]MVB11470.1 3-oxoacyl-[acyl-carrier-protein] synthase 2 [Caproicibacter fermentans]OCN02304.1 beta-ketoacyl-[acyl-carrier-protein] synthase II [Clostridium sp. W14A]